MKAVVIEKPGSVALREMDLPAPPSGFARIAVQAAAICATDLEVLDGNIPAGYSLIPGHEWSGVVDGVGSDEDAGWIGKRVVGSNDVVCLKCEACRSGNWRYCSQFEEIGFWRNGAYADYLIAPAYGLCELPPSVSFVHGALCEPLGVALGTMEKAGARFADTLLIMGAGSIGLCMLAVGRAMGLRRIVVCASSERRLTLAKRMGAHAVVSTSSQDLFAEMANIHPGGSDVVIDATGIDECIGNCLRLTRKGGCCALAGYSRGRLMTIRPDDIHINNLRVVGAGNNWNQHQRAVTCMAEGLIDIECLATHFLPLERYAEGLELARTRPEGFVKAVFVR